MGGFNVFILSIARNVLHAALAPARCDGLLWL